MKTLRHIFIITLLAFSTQLVAQRIDGNGTRETRAFDFKGIEVINFNVTVEAEIDLSMESELFVRVDENLFDHMIIKQRGNELKIDQDGWIEPSSPIEVVLGLNGLKKIKNSAWGHITIKNMDQSEFRAMMEVGTLVIDGKVESFEVSTGSGKIDASRLNAQNVDANIRGNGQMLLNAQSSLQYGGDEDGKIVYLGSPDIKAKKANSVVLRTLEEDQALASEELNIAYVEVKLKNNSGKKRQLRFSGPVAKPFGYGFPLSARGTRTENVPVGTKVYQVNPLGKDKLLVTIGQGDDGKSVKLYGESK